MQTKFCRYARETSIYQDLSCKRSSKLLLSSREHHKASSRTAKNGYVSNQRPHKQSRRTSATCNKFAWTYSKRWKLNTSRHSRYRLLVHNRAMQMRAKAKNYLSGWLLNWVKWLVIWSDQALSNRKVYRNRGNWISWSESSNRLFNQWLMKNQVHPSCLSLDCRTFTAAVTIISLYKTSKEALNFLIKNTQCSSKRWTKTWKYCRYFYLFASR